ncbi:PREDICTED: endocuticle structural glycoprotein ABD-4-like [Nicrophorus vespilloides]|uniref:Endocuticle structural glycoprotein ABD-4-like n=1 Tax=Nicrophorus vespilloides TaxID=110193 RepID=A0ABM1NG22_NICVS|nr:PREDICTED: endocuticle structural glycoprotein ABD-4-like [Nicrophorus vespilloides]
MSSVCALNNCLFIESNLCINTVLQWSSSISFKQTVKMLAVKVFFLVGVLGCALAEKEEIPIISQESVLEPDGSYRHSYETGDGIKAEVIGELKTIGDETVAVAHGSYSYPAEDGKTYQVSYVADENGYQPIGDHLPVAPEIPAIIKKSLDYLATAPPPKE